MRGGGIIHTTEYYSAIKKNEVQIHVTTLMGLKAITLSEKSQSQKATYCMIPPMEHSQNDASIEMEHRLVVAKG